MSTPNPEKMDTGTGNGGEDVPAIIERSAAGDVAGAIVGGTDKQSMGFFVKCLGIGAIILCIGACAALVLYGGFFVKTDAEKALEKRLEIPKDLVGAAGNTVEK